MPKPYLILNLLFFPSIILGNVLLAWALWHTKRAGIYPTTRVFCFQKAKPFQQRKVLQTLQTKCETTEDPAEARRYRRWILAFYFGNGLCFFALAVLLAFVPWLFSQIP